jgi:hypothetical protein
VEAKHNQRATANLSKDRGRATEVARQARRHAGEPNT